MDKGEKMVKSILKFSVNFIAGISLFLLPRIVSVSLGENGLFGESFIVEYICSLTIYALTILFLARSINQLIEAEIGHSTAKEN